MTTITAAPITISPEQHAFYAQNGYLIVRGLFSAAETAHFRDHLTALRESGQSFPNDYIDGVPSANDPLKRYPRFLQMHPWDATSLSYLLDARLNACLTALLGREPLAVQTMLYFKPAGARGQAMHQDNFYLRVQPGTCMAAWTALDLCDEANGCMRLVPGSHTWPLLCTQTADATQSFTDIEVPIPDGVPVVSAIMEPGDVLFFNGSLVHGSLPNTTTDRFRRALIAHYIEGDSQQVAKWYDPVLRMDGTRVEIAPSDLGGACGVWTETEGVPTIELSGHDAVRDAEAK